MNTSEILDKAADLIVERGWAQGWYVDHCGGLCVRGAMYVAVGVTPPGSASESWYPIDADAHRGVYEATRVMDEFVGKPVERWNDGRRTAAEVVSALRAAAAEAARAET